ncbi:MAG: RecX family transcriptional regulator [Roseomonas sp.]|nr:RecX family transcriptional regulator [Roseomonas sp.]MCA3390612.1 RecX family transcriptional regulator [Roseomonas sp.]MCA3406865.1 RecX family transcriptional regulator [Roseomonas sp.]
MSDAPKRPRRAVGAPPNAARLREAALAHLARFAATEAGLRRVLERRVARWARAAEAEGQSRETIAASTAALSTEIASIAQSLVAAGAVNDAAFAESRARRLARSGHSRRAIAAHLAAKGIETETATAALPEGEEAELLAAIAFCRRRRIGPFARVAPDAPARMKALAALARGGFAQGLARRALAMDPDQAEEMLLAGRRG